MTTLLIGSTVTVLGALRCLGRRGVPVTVHAPLEAVVRKSRWFADSRVNGGATTIERLLEAGSGGRSKPVVLIPCNDSSALEVAQFITDDVSDVVASVPPAEVLQTFIDKGRFSQVLARTGVPHPVTKFLEGSQLPPDLPDAIFQNAFLKPRNSQLFFKRFGVKAMRVGSRADAERRLTELVAQGFSMLVQEYIPGPSSNHYFVDGFIDREGEIKAFFARRRLRMYPPDFGNSSYMVTVPLTEVGGAVEALEMLVPHVGHRGVFSAEFKQDPRDGLFKILEVNARPWWYVEFAARCGVDVCWMAYQDALGRKIDPVFTYPVGKSLVYTYYDLFACWDMWRRGELRLRNWVRSWLSSQHPIFCWDDPWPAVVQTARFIRRHIRMPGSQPSPES